jgi:rhomboid protease GluP
MVSIMWNSAEISGGASGAIFGLFGILLALLSTDFYEKSARKALLISTAIFVAYNIIPIGEGIDHAAHFGGLVSGYFFGWMAYFGLSHKNSSVKKWGLAFFVTVVSVVFVSCAIMLSPQYQTKQYEALMDKAEKQFNDINSDFYHSPDSITRQQKLDIMEHRALPEIKELKKTANKITHLILSRRKKKEAIARAKLIDLECQTFQLLYRQFKEQNNYKYQEAIDNITGQINKVRTDYAKDN